MCIVKSIATLGVVHTCSSAYVYVKVLILDHQYWILHTVQVGAIEYKLNTTTACVHAERNILCEKVIQKISRCMIHCMHDLRKDSV